MRKKTYTKTVEFGVTEWMHDLLSHVAEMEERSMASVFRMAVVDKYPELVMRFKRELERELERDSGGSKEGGERMEIRKELEEDEGVDPKAGTYKSMFEDEDEYDGDDFDDED